MFITYLEAAGIFALILALIMKELVRAYNGENAGVWIKRLNIAIAPLLVIFGLIIVLRLIGLISSGVL